MYIKSVEVCKTEVSVGLFLVQAPFANISWKGEPKEVTGHLSAHCQDTFKQLLLQMHL